MFLLWAIASKIDILKDYLYAKADNKIEVHIFYDIHNLKKLNYLHACAV